MTQSSLRIPIRFKIAALITTSIGISLMSVIWIATTLMQEDKASYIYDLSMAQSRSVADSLEHRIGRIHDTARVLARLAGDPALETIYKEQEGGSTLGAFLLLRPTADLSRFNVEASLGAKAKEAEALVAELGWTPAVVNKDGMLAGSSAGGWIPLAGKAIDRTGVPLAYFVLAQPEPRLPEDTGAVEIRVLDTQGEKVDKLPSSLSGESIKRLGKALSLAPFPAGVREWKESGVEYIVSYQRIASGKLTVASITPREKAFEAARTLRNRSLALGVSVFLVALGLTLAFSRTLTGKLRTMWNATQRISQGDFTTRVELDSRINDEVTDLAGSFNVMTDKINELMKKTAEKARLENELKTAQVVQSYLFPSKGLAAANYRISGRFLPATECGGDWWSCLELHGALIAVVGDVTGHGASAALITAVAYGAFHAYVQEIRSRPGLRPDIQILVSRLNEAVLTASNSDSSMTFLAVSLDPVTGQLEYCNAGHCIPYIHRRSKSPDAPNPLKRFIALTGDPGPALGIEASAIVPKYGISLSPGDVVILYSDGLIECENEEKQQLGRTAMLRMLDDLLAKLVNDPDSIPQRVMDFFLRFLGTASESRADDTTVVALAIPADARFASLATPSTAPGTPAPVSDPTPAPSAISAS